MFNLGGDGKGFLVVGGLLGGGRYGGFLVVLYTDKVGLGRFVWMYCGLVKFVGL